MSRIKKKNFQFLIFFWRIVMCVLVLVLNECLIHEVRMFNQHHRGYLVKYSKLQKPEAFQLPFYLLTPFTLPSWVPAFLPLQESHLSHFHFSSPLPASLVSTSWCSGFDCWFHFLLTAGHILEWYLCEPRFCLQ